MTVSAAPSTIGLISKHGSYWLSLETNLDDYNSQGGMRMKERGRRVRFTQNRAQCPAEWREEIEAHSLYGIDFWLEDDAAVSLPAGALNVVSGQVTALGARINAGQVNEPTEPLAGWDDKLAAREIRVALAEGRVSDLQGALAWECRAEGGRARGQVLEALGKAIRAANGEDDDNTEAGGL
jgi:hypothetical protein